MKLKCMKYSEFRVVSNRNEPWPISGEKENNILKSHWVAQIQSCGRLVNQEQRIGRKESHTVDWARILMPHI